MASWPFALPRSRHLRWVFPKCNNNLTSLEKIAGGAENEHNQQYEPCLPARLRDALEAPPFPRRSSVQAALRPFGSLEDLLWVTSF
jgi:hypothetical protein